VCDGAPTRINSNATKIWIESKSNFQIKTELLWRRAYLQSCCNHEVLLFKTQFLALKEVIVGVEDASNVLGNISIDHSLDVITIVD
jgi:hypothetical protein